MSAAPRTLEAPGSGEHVGPGLHICDNSPPTWSHKREKSEERPKVGPKDMRRAHQEDFADRVNVRWADKDLPAGRISTRKRRVDLHSREQEGPSEAQKECGRDIVPRMDAELFRSEEEGRSYWKGIKTCGSVWCCPVCARRILRRKGRKLQEIITEHRRAGGEAYLVSGTIPHHAGQTTYEVAEAVLESCRFLFRGSPWERWADRIGLVAKVRAIDGTYGPNGPHPHVHILLLTDRELSEEVEARLLHFLKLRWERKVESWRVLEDGDERVIDAFPLNRRLPEDHQPHFGRPDRLKGLQLQRGEYAGDYVSNLGLGREATRMDVKRGRGREHFTPWEVLHEYTVAKLQGDEARQRRMAGWWLSWCQAMHGRRHLTGLKRAAEAVDAQIELFEDDELTAPEEADDAERVLSICSGLFWRLRWIFPHGLTDGLEYLSEHLTLDELRELLDGMVEGSKVALDRERRRFYAAPP